MIDISRAQKVNGWMSDDELTYLAEAASKSKRIVEIGSWAGRSATAIASHTNGVLFCVDTWERALVHYNGAVLEPTLFAEFLQNTAGLPIIPVMTDSLTAAKWFADSGMTADMVFVDATHEAPAVRADVLAWKEILAPGAIFCGHDYEQTGWPDVKPVIDEFVRDGIIAPVRIIGSIWTTEP